MAIQGDNEMDRGTPLDTSVLDVMEPDTMLLRTKDLAVLLGVTENTLWGWRRKGVGPRYIWCEGSVRYRVEDVKEYIEKCGNNGNNNGGV